MPNFKLVGWRYHVESVVNRLYMYRLTSHILVVCIYYSGIRLFLILLLNGLINFYEFVSYTYGSPTWFLTIVDPIALFSTLE